MTLARIVFTAFALVALTVTWTVCKRREDNH